MAGRFSRKSSGWSVVSMSSVSRARPFTFALFRRSAKWPRGSGTSCDRGTGFRLGDLRPDVARNRRNGDDQDVTRSGRGLANIGDFRCDQNDALFCRARHVRQTRVFGEAISDRRSRRGGGAAVAEVGIQRSSAVRRASRRARVIDQGSLVQRAAIFFPSSPGTQITTAFAPAGPVLWRTVSGGLT